FLLFAVIMSSATSVVTYTSVYTDSEPDRAFWGADDEEISEGGILRIIVSPSPDYIPGPKDPQTLPVPQDEDEREPIFQLRSSHYLLLIYLLSESPGYVTESDPKEDPEETEDGPVDYPIDGGDDGEDDDDDSSGDDADGEDEDDEDE
ncbi:hypothetical protein Tco_0338072, partial [Tanacetum coccineum]